MAVSMNTQAVWVTKANVFKGGLSATHGNVLVGDKAIEFYNERNPEDYLQIPWTEIERVRAQMYCGDRYIRGFYIDTKSAGTFNFIVKNAGKTLKVMRDYVGNERIVRHVPPFSLVKWFKKGK